MCSAMSGCTPSPRRAAIEQSLGWRQGIFTSRLKRFRAKWKPVRVKKTRQIKNLEPRFDSIETGLWDVNPQMADVRFGAHSGLKSDIARGPKSAKHGSCRAKKKPPEGGFSIQILMMDQAAINAGFDFRRYAMKPMPAKPRIIIAHVEGSGTAATPTPPNPSEKRCCMLPNWDHRS